MDSVALAQAVQTPQVILGVDYDGIFQKFEDIRAPINKIQENLSVAEWYVKAVGTKDAIFLSTLENSDILSFTHKFNSDSPQDQGLFVFEVLDPANIFEHRFLDFFYNRTQLDRMTDANSWLTDQILPTAVVATPASPHPRMTTAGELFQQEQTLLDKYTSDTQWAAGERKTYPFTRSVCITCGIGNDIKTWSPVQRCSLVAMDYDLTKEGLRKLTLKFVPNPGLLRYNEQDAVDEYLTAGAKTLIQIQQDFITVNKTKDKLLVKEPGEVVLDLISKSLTDTTETPPVLLLDNLKFYLNKRWKKACITAVNQFLPTSTAIRMSKAITASLTDENIVAISSDTDTDVLEEQEELRDKLKEVGGGASNISETTDKMVGARKKLVDHMLQFNENQEGPGQIASFEEGLLVAGGDINKEIWTSFTGESPWTPLSQQISIDTVTEGNWQSLFLKLNQYRRGWSFNKTRSRELSHLSEAGKQQWEFSREAALADLPAAPLNQAAIDNYAWDYLDSAYSEGWAQDEWGTASPYNAEGLAAQNTGMVPAELKDPSWLARKLGIHALKELWYKNLYHWHYLDKQGAIESSTGIKEIYNVGSIEVNTVEMYKIYLKAAQIFFTGLGMQLLERGHELKRRGTLPIGSNPNILAPRGAPDKTLIEGAIRPIFIQISAKNIQGIRGHVDNILQSLGAHSDLDPYISCFSEIGLINRCVTNFRKAFDAGKVVGEKYSFLSQASPKILFIVASYDVMGSLIQGDELDEDDLTGKNAAYLLLKKAFADFRAAEPNITSNAGGLGKMFQNPEPNALMLPSDNDAPNMLALYNDSGLEFANNDELNKYLSEKKIPVFNYGFENSNILDFHFDLKIWYAYLLTLVPEMLTDELTIRGVNSLDITDSILKFYEAEGAPEDIKGVIGRWYDSEYGNRQGIASLLNSPTNFMAVNVVAGVPGAAPPPVGPTSVPPSPWNTVSQQMSPHLPHRQLFIDNMYNFLITILSRPATTRSLLFDPTDDQSEIVNDLLNIRSKLSNRTFAGRVTTVPFFSLMSMAKTLGKPALLYFLEPEAMASNEYKEGGERNTWLSGEYYIVGFEVRIAGNSVTTSFNLLKNASNK